MNLKHCFRKIGLKKAANDKEYLTVNLPTDIGFEPRTQVEIIPATYGGRDAAIIVKVATQPCGIVAQPRTTITDDAHHEEDVSSLDMRHTPSHDSVLSTDVKSNSGITGPPITQSNGKAWEAQIITIK